MHFHILCFRATRKLTSFGIFFAQTVRKEACNVNIRSMALYELNTKEQTTDNYKISI